MDFKLKEEQDEFRKLAKEFGARELAPLAETCDKHPEKAAPLYQKVFESGLMNVQMPEKSGGLGLCLWDAVLIAEGLAQGCSGISAAIEYSALAQLPILVAGSESQLETFLTPLNDKVSFGGIASQTLFDEECAVTAVESGDDYILTGSCSRVFNAGQSEWYIIDAIIDRPHSERLTFIVPRNARGLSVKDKLFSVGRKAADIHSVELHDVRVAQENLLQSLCETETRSRFQNSARALIAAGMIGVAQSAFENAKRYANERQTFGKPIAQHQAIAFMMADMAKDIEAARELTWQAAILIDKGSSSARPALSALIFAGEMAMRVTTDAVQVYGGYGYSKEYPVEKLMRDAKTYQCMIPSGPMLKASLGHQLLSV